LATGNNRALAQRGQDKGNSKNMAKAHLGLMP